MTRVELRSTKVFGPDPAGVIQAVFDQVKIPIHVGSAQLECESSTTDPVLTASWDLHREAIFRFQVPDQMNAPNFNFTAATSEVVQEGNGQVSILIDFDHDLPSYSGDPNSQLTILVPAPEGVTKVLGCRVVVDY